MLCYMGAGRWQPYVLAWVLAAGAIRPAAADGFVAVYSAWWAGLPAAEIRLEAHDADGRYDAAIAIESRGLPRLFTHFRGIAQSAGRLSADGMAQPQRYDTAYDLHRRRGSHIGMRFAAHDGVVVAERGPGDTSRKPLLAEIFRRNVVDPLAAFERIRAALRRGGRFTVPVYDGARRFDVVGRVLPRRDGALHVRLTLRPIAGFKGETSEDGDPDDAPRPVDLLVSDDHRLMPLAMTVPVWFLPLSVRLDHVCAGPPAPIATGQACRR
jgi:hypothetical protein